MMLAHVLVEYEIKLADPTMQLLVLLRKIRVANPFITIMICQRVTNGDDSKQAASAGV